MPNPLLAIALDAADGNLLRRWAGDGLLPNVRRLLDRGSAFTLANGPTYRNEHPWTSLLTGCSPDRTGYWTPLRYFPEGYRAADAGAFSFRPPYRPFYAWARGRRVTVFDLPHCGRLFDEVDGIQVLGWGAHSPMGGPRSRPREILPDLRRRFGRHPALRTQDRGSWWEDGRLRRLRAALLEGIRRRGAVVRALMAERPADLVVAAFSEAHVGGHHFWHLGDRGHPAHGHNRAPLADFLLDVYRQTDRELGRVLDGAPANANVLVFSPEGGAENWCDLNSMVFLPELLFRWSFPGRSLLAGGARDGSPREAVVHPRVKDWVEAVWLDRYDRLPPPWVPRSLAPPFRAAAAVPVLRFPFYVLRRLGPLQWQPAIWYRPWWPDMEAFALPSYGDGYIRVNLRGREPRGIVPAERMEPLCRALTERLLRLRDPRTGQAMVGEVVRTGGVHSDSGAGPRPDADLVVVWNRRANDMIEDPGSGILGPLPFWKTGSHRDEGFLVGLGPDIPGPRAPGRARTVDVAPTVLRLLGCERPDHLEGRPLFA